MERVAKPGEGEQGADTGFDPCRFRTDPQPHGRPRRLCAAGNLARPERRIDVDERPRSQNQAFNAILFFYKDVLGHPLQGVDALRVTRPPHMRHAPSIGETQALLHAIRNVGGYPTNLIACMLYGCGLRVSEPLNLRIKDVDFQQSRLCIRGAKGGKDRMVALPATLVPEIRQQVNVARAMWERDQQDKIPLMLPQGLA